MTAVHLYKYAPFVAACKFYGSSMAVVMALLQYKYIALQQIRIGDERHFDLTDLWVIGETVQNCLKYLSRLKNV